MWPFGQSRPALALGERVEHRVELLLEQRHPRLDEDAPVADLELGGRRLLGEPRQVGGLQQRVEGHAAGDLEDLHGSFGFPAVVKPRGEGSSLGVHRVDDLAGLAHGQLLQGLRGVPDPDFSLAAEILPKAQCERVASAW